MHPTKRLGVTQTFGNIEQKVHDSGLWDEGRYEAYLMALSRDCGSILYRDYVGITFPYTLLRTSKHAEVYNPS